MAVSFLMLLLLVLALVPLGLIVAGLLVKLGAGANADGAPGGGRCGKCGYSVNQLETMTCPECGADLREAGIRITRGGKTGTVLIIVGVVLLVVMLGCVGMSLVGLGYRSSQQVPVQAVPAPPSTPTPPSPTTPSTP